MDEPLNDLGTIGIVVIGRNEGERLKRCLRSLPSGISATYVDSGSTDGSVAFARSMGMLVIELDMQIPFTAARARNIGWRTLVDKHSALEMIQFIDGDCEVADNWFQHAQRSLIEDEKLAAVFGRTRERFPHRSIFNRMCDDEWSVPIGLTESCGGNVMFRISALRAAEGFADSLIAGEEPDLCLRLRRAGWKIRCIDHEMTLHDAAITSFRAFWKRTRRSGFAFAEHVWRHGRNAIPSWRRQLYGIVFWGLALPLLCLAFIALIPLSNATTAFTVFFAVLLAYALQIFRIARRKSSQVHDRGFAAAYGTLIVVGKLAQGLGTLECWSGHLLRKETRLIEYKKP